MSGSMVLRGPAVGFRRERATGGAHAADGRGPVVPRIRAVHPDLPSDRKLAGVSRDGLPG